MTAVKTIERALESGLLDRLPINIPSAGADAKLIDTISVGLPRKLSPTHREILERWDGLNLDVIRMYSAGPAPSGTKQLAPSQAHLPLQRGIVFGDDPAGFLYLEDADGRIFSLDSHSDELTQVASDLDDFFDSVLFGTRALDFLGEDWLKDLRRFGLI